ncbi:MAG: hypothetical protein A3H32_10750 [Betaproteobacteria bacterium RIFCSPLOWO2_02_FULL_63_19]|nr:MAG: hypothetical protein A3H32_10750 [Betaproteobacteria bacterium RIFCSPLOWO2_02_FULL_63_19]
MTTRRNIIAAAMVVAIAAGAAEAAPPTVEILSMSHWPVQSALKPVREFLARQGSRVRVVQKDVEGPDGEKRLKSIGLKGHIPLVLIIDGQHRYKRADGRVVEFVNFPAAAGNPMGLNGAWTTADFESALLARLK